MAESSWFSRHFLTGILQNAAWDGAKQVLGGSLMTSLGAALWQYLKHRSVDWWGIIALFILTFVVLLYRRRGDGERAKEPPPAKGEPSKEELDADAEQKRWRKWANDHNLNYFYNLGTEADRLFTPLQMEAFGISRRISELSREFGPEPQFAPVHGFGVKESAEQYAAYQDELTKWAIRLNSAYELKLKTTLNALLNKFGIEGISDLRLNDLASQFVDENKSQEIAARMICLIHKANGVSVIPEEPK